MLRTIGTGLVGFGIGIGALAGIAVTVSQDGPDPLAEFYGGEYAMDEPSMLQTDFPCQEDEVLGFDPIFGTEHVGCLSIESFR